MRISITAQRIAEKTSDAYSANRYRSWDAVIQFLLDRGYEASTVEIIVRSKWTRWAADRANKHANATAEDFRRWLLATYPTAGEEFRAVLALIKEDGR
jgi:hypothetical protein